MIRPRSDTERYRDDLADAVSALQAEPRVASAEHIYRTARRCREATLGRAITGAEQVRLHTACRVVYSGRDIVPPTLARLRRRT